MNSQQIFFQLTLCLLFAAGLLGCGRTDVGGPQPQVAEQSGLNFNAFEVLKQQRAWETGDVEAKTQQLWDDVQKFYGGLNRYSDRAQVQLRYELLGNVMFEAMPVTVSFDRESGAWESQFFRTHLYGDAQYHVMTVKEAATNHLDRQVKLLALSKEPRQLAEGDPVAQIYLSGATDLPLSEPAMTQLALLLPQMEWLSDHRPAPSTSGEGKEPEVESNPIPKCRYQGWAVYNDFRCLKLSRIWYGYETEFWIDVDAKLIRKMVLSKSMLHGELAETPEVRGLELQIDFTEIATGADARSPQGFASFPADRTVQRLVKIPEAFPSPWIGRVSPILMLKSQENATLQLPTSQRPTVALFLSQIDVNAAWWHALSSTATNSNLSTATVALILDGIDTQPRTTNVAHRPLAATNPFLVPNGAEAWQTIGLNQGRWLVIWDAHGMVQYVGPAEIDNLSDTIVKVLQRIQQGEAIGEEMIREYQNFYTNYLAQLDADRATTLPERVGGPLRESLPNNRPSPDNP